MSGDWNDRRAELLDLVQTMGGQGRAEGESRDSLARGFYPVAEHLRMLDPDVVLVVGPRGAGKTEIARVLTDTDLGPAILKHAPAVRLPSGSATWKAAFPIGREGFDDTGLRRFVASHAAGHVALGQLWFAYLLRVLRDSLDGDAHSDLDALLSLPGGDPEHNYAALLAAGSKPLLALDRLDQRLEKERKYIFVTYDELDTIGSGDWKLMEASIRGLVGFWASYARRWSRIRAKVFLRTDLYERHLSVGGADMAKLAAGRVELGWSDKDLYGMLLKRFVNAGEAMNSYVQRPKSRIEWRDAGKLGLVPVLASWRDARPVLERMVGQYMGANRKKGLVYRWLLDHVRDGRGRALPRPFVRLIEEGARIELRELHALREPRLFDPSSLRRALDRVSDEYVVHAFDEWPWLKQVRELIRGELVPWDRERDVVRLLESERLAAAKDAPPFEGRDLLDYLVEIGILRRRPDNRIDAPDLYLAGLGLKRKGGVRRK